MTIRRIIPLAIAGVVALGAGGWTLPPRPQADLLDRAVAAWAKVKTVRATFEQTIVNPLTGNTLTSTGEYQQQRPGKLSVKFDNPATDRIVADGQYVWLYLPSSVPDQVIKSPLGSTGTGTVDLTAQFLSAPRKRYTVTGAGTLAVGGRPTHGYTLVPKSPGNAPFKTATVYVDDADATVRQFVVTEPNGVQRTVRLTSFRPNAPVDPKAFVFVVPPGTRVVAR
jgi:outer membrane lipoprotein carrier protein